MSRTRKTRRSGVTLGLLQHACGPNPAENLATWVGGQIRDRMRERWPSLRVLRLEVGVEETPGQRGVYCRED